jgi:hypothetical protein
MGRTYGSPVCFTIFFNGLIRRMTDVVTILVEATPLKSEIIKSPIKKNFISTLYHSDYLIGGLTLITHHL